MTAPVLWFHRGTAPQVAVYPDDVAGVNPLKRFPLDARLAPVHWVHRGSSAMKAQYPDACTSERLQHLPIAGGEQPVHWVHRGTKPLTVAFPDDVGTQQGGGEESYTGPLDIVPGAVIALGQRAMSAAMCGQPYATIREDSGGTTQEFSFGSDGAIPVASINTSLNGATGFVRKWNDGSGNDRFLEQETAGNQPVWNANGPNSKPFFSAVAETPTVLGNFDAAPFSLNAFTYFLVFRVSAGEFGSQILNIASNSTSAQVLASLTASYELSLQVSDDDNDFVAGVTPSETIPTDDFCVLEIVCAAGAVLTVSVNGVNKDVTTVDSSGTVGDLTDLIQTIEMCSGASDRLSLTEYMLYPSALSAGNRSALRTDIMSFYGIS